MRAKLVIWGLLPLLAEFIVEATYASVTESRALYQGIDAKAKWVGALLASVQAVNVALKDSKATEENFAHLEHDADFSFGAAPLLASEERGQEGSRPHIWHPRRSTAPARRALAESRQAVDVLDRHVGAEPVVG